LKAHNNSHFGRLAHIHFSPKLSLFGLSSFSALIVCFISSSTYLIILINEHHEAVLWKMFCIDVIELNESYVPDESACDDLKNNLNTFIYNNFPNLSIPK
jgi:hypothetical protein